MPARRRNATQNLVQDSKSGMWNARWREDGRLRTKSLDTRKLAEAQKLVAPFMAQVNAERYGIVQPEEKRSPVLWQDVLEAYRSDSETYPTNPETRIRYEIDLNRIGQYLDEEDIRPTEITDRTVNRLVSEMRLDELSTSSIKYCITAWTRAMSAAAFDNLIPASATAPVRFFDRSRLRNDEEKPRPPLNGEFERLLPEVEALAPRLAVYVQFLHRTGCRAGEVLAARAEDIHRGRDGLRIWLNRATKGQKRRSILLNAAEELVPLLPKRGRLFADLPEEVAAVSGAWKAFWQRRLDLARSRAAAEDRALTEWEERRWRLHDHRHAFACEAILADAELLALRDHLGHASYTTTERYIKMLSQLPVEQRRPLKMFWKGRRQVWPEESEQPEVDDATGRKIIALLQRENPPPKGSLRR